MISVSQKEQFKLPLTTVSYYNNFLTYVAQFFLLSSYLMKNTLLIISLLFSTNILNAQIVSGSWYGKAEVDLSGNHNNYLTELILKQKGDEVEGIFAYYFKDVYQSYYIHGHYNAKSREIIIPNIPIIFYSTNSTIYSIECNTNFLGILFVSAVKKAINGYLYHDEKYKYMCPDLRVNFTFYESGNQDSALKYSNTGKKFWNPQPDDFVVNSTDSNKETIVPDTVRAKINATTGGVASKSKITNPSKGPAGIKKITESFAKRKTIFNQDLWIESDSVEASFYDNGDIDGDSISVFLNNKLVLSHQGLTAKAINVFMQLDSTKEVNEISMFAENLGTIPPNTALMVITDGKNRYEVFMSSSLTQNSTVRLKRKKK